MRRLLSSPKDFAKRNNAGPFLYVKVLFMTGSTTDIVSENGVLEQYLLFLAKPITPQVLLKKVRAVLGKHV